ncbi:DUF4255 domain-containing protein [Deinococcus sp. Arct2-2]|uniref:DUF4255 domain-containing protein n=1 Tax=Deinococcus sp. Arct2-2 TaxID=2568653 RepID=UPI0010A3CD97|nr:DUF4255 domain-containing protein [Deinococcus sp. Arct2-2]THF69537.1 DUF4255 domain-containing protein [Deinococcus sp. Arct2-2]
MLSQIHDALRTLLFEEARLPEDQLDIRFGTPTGDWVSGLTRPTVNFFMHDITENMELRRMDQMTVQDRGRVVQHLAPRRINLRYLITVFFKAQTDDSGRDEWEVLWRVLAALMRHPDWPEEALPQVVRRLGLTVHGRVAQPDGPRTGELFSGLGLSLRPHLTYTLTVPLDLDVQQVSRLVLERDTSLNLVGDPEPALHSARSSWRVQSVSGQPLEGVLVTASTGVQGYTDAAGLVTLDLLLSAAGSFTLQAPSGQVQQVEPDLETNVLTFA